MVATPPWSLYLAALFTVFLLSSGSGRRAIFLETGSRFAVRPVVPMSVTALACHQRDPRGVTSLSCHAESKGTKKERKEKPKPRIISKISFFDVWKQKEGVEWSIRYRGQLRDDPLHTKPIKVLAVCQIRNVTKILSDPLSYTTNFQLENVEQEFGFVDMSRVSVKQITDVDHPDKVAEEIGSYEPEVLLIDSFLSPWPGEIIMNALMRAAKRHGYKRPQYILGIGDVALDNRLLIANGADGYIKKSVLYGWEQWPKLDFPITTLTKNRTKYGQTKEYASLIKEQKESFLAFVKGMEESGELEPFRDVLGFQYLRNHPQIKNITRHVPLLDLENTYYDYIGIHRIPTYPNGSTISEPEDIEGFGRFYANGTVDRTYQPPSKEEQDEETEREMGRKREERQKRMKEIEEAERKKRVKEENMKNYP
uniref:Uncharacterized protein n=1 Tax=Amorphochlora amoebiformis TaxID=1561963 RepID=A0A7S0DN95_9EUKA|mmetsp:Transcript_33164/g.53260  ORF Transcript_33164/g.53260 Transcript_33164/m.53260 type:complete len:424 (+) Transcript_33164:17-1288(+)